MLVGALFHDAVLVGALFHDAVLVGALFHDAVLVGALFHDAVLVGALFHDAPDRQATFSTRFEDVRHDIGNTAGAGHVVGSNQAAPAGDSERGRGH